MPEYPYRQPTSVRVDGVRPKMSLLAPAETGTQSSCSPSRRTPMSHEIRADSHASRGRTWSYYVFRQGIRMLLGGENRQTSEEE
jgi:hypothetical protein